MYYVYVLKSQKDGKRYIGYTNHVQHRFDQHRNGEVASTKPRRPLELIFCEAFRDQTKALQREKYFKTTKGKVALDRMLA